MHPYCYYIPISQMSSVNQSNVAIRIKNEESCIVDMEEELQAKNNEEIDVKQTPIITQNVPFTNPIKSISKWYIFFNLNFNCACLLIIVLLNMDWVQLLGTYLLISYVIISYIVYLAVAYKFSNLIFLTDLRSLHEYEVVFHKLVTAECALKFTYIPSRNRIDQSVKRYEQDYKKVSIADRSGRLYHIERQYSLALIRYNKRFYYSDSNVRTKVTNDFNEFVQKCRREFENNKRRLLNSREKIELVIKDLSDEIGYYVQEDNHYKCLFLGTLLLGLAVYFECFMSRKILRYEMDIVKEICLK